MAQPQIFTGSWQDLATHADAFRGHTNLTLIVPPENSNQENELTPLERIAVIDALAERNRHLPNLPEETFDRENLSSV